MRGRCAAEGKRERRLSGAHEQSSKGSNGSSRIDRITLPIGGATRSPLLADGGSRFLRALSLGEQQAMCPHYLTFARGDDSSSSTRSGGTRGSKSSQIRSCHLPSAWLTSFAPNLSSVATATA